MRLRATRTFLAEPALPPPLLPLRDLSRNLYWCWNTDAAALFERVDRRAWEASGHNPVALLQSVPRETFALLAEDEPFLAHLGRVSAMFEHYLSRPPLATVEGVGGDSIIAYFSMEYGLTESLPNYSGGLGVLAGDHLKTASDLGLPLVAVGLLYRQGYFHQQLEADGWQTEHYSEMDVASQPVDRVSGPDGQPLSVSVPIAGRDVRLAVWKVAVGRVPLYLLDTDCEENSDADRAMGRRLYGGDIETRIQQEIVLGVGGVRALHALGLHPAVCHMNEGHSALLGVERIRAMMEERDVPFDLARIPVSSATVFTTHTAVAAGIDLFAPDLVTRYLGEYYRPLGLDDARFLGLGRMRPEDEYEPFSMALLGIRLSGERNGVSELHGHVSRKLWEGAWPELPNEQAPIGAVTNGVHLPTWVSHGMGGLYDRAVGPEWRDIPASISWKGIWDVPDEELWAVHERRRAGLVHLARKEHRAGVARRGLADGAPGLADVLDPEALTIGFARRFASYKRATLLFRDPERLAAIVGQTGRPVQFIFAGKAHPRDEPAKHLIREVVQYSHRPEFAGKLIMLEHYDIELARALVQGCDVWLNTPLRPLEASGTSGMKAVANGALHLSVLDGWWAEAYEPGLGWAIGGESTADDPDVQDAFDAESLYDLLEHEVAPLFYERDEAGMPREWVQWMKRSVAAFAPQFSTHRMLRDYIDEAYTPAARSWQRLRPSHGDAAGELAAWLATVRAAWPAVKVFDVNDNTSGAADGREVQVTVQASLGPLRPTDIQADVLFGPADAAGEMEQAGSARMAFEGQGEDGLCTFRAVFLPTRGGRIGYAVRVLPAHPDLHNPLDLGLVYWA